VAGVVKQSPPPRRGPRFQRRTAGERLGERLRKITGGGNKRKKSGDEEGSRLATASDILMEHEENIEDYRVLFAKTRECVNAHVLRGEVFVSRGCAWILEGGKRGSRVVRGLSNGLV